MSNKVETRTMADAYHVEVERWNGKVLFIVHGSNKSGDTLKFKITCSFSLWPCIVATFRKVWASERQTRIAEIEAVNEALPREQS